MLSQSDRNRLENQIINAMLVYENFFLKIYDLNPNADDLFLNVSNREIYEAITEYYVERGYPTLPDVFNQLILKNAAEETKQHFSKNISSADPTADFNIVFRLIEDTIEVRTRNSIKLIEKKNLSGLDYSQSLREEVDKIILEKFECYKRDTRSNEEKVNDLLKTIEQTREGKSSDYLKTGFHKIDEAIIGFPKSHLTVIAARPSIGKTSFMLALKRNLVEQGFRPLVISIEMTADQLLLKDLSAYTEIDSLDIESGKLTDPELKKLHDAANLVSKENYFIEDSGSWTIERIKATVRRYLIKQQIDIVFLDYLTLINTPSRKDRFDLAIGELTGALREFAKETGLPIVILSQLNREVEKRSDKRPQLSDLRESGSIEQDAKTCLFLYRPSNYGIDPFASTGNEFKTKDGQSLKAEEYFEVIIGKARNGKVGITTLQYIPKYHKFENVWRKSEGFNSQVQYNTQGSHWFEKETDEYPI
jgi:replicative DNA helicase